MLACQTKFKELDLGKSWKDQFFHLTFICTFNLLVFMLFVNMTLFLYLRNIFHKYGYSRPLGRTTYSVKSAFSSMIQSCRKTRLKWWKVMVARKMQIFIILLKYDIAFRACALIIVITNQIWKAKEADKIYFDLVQIILWKSLLRNVRLTL